MSAAFTARCTGCGGSLPIALAGPAPPCPHCGAPFAVGPDLASRISRLRQAVASRDSRAEQLIGKQARLGRDLRLGFLLAPLSLWILGFFMLAYTIDTPGMGLLDVLTEEGTGDPAFKAWALTGLAGVIGLSLISYGIGLHRIRSLVRYALPLPPIAAGAPPRCRVCGADLGLEGRIRQCEYCAADHLITGQYQSVDAAIDSALTDHERALNKTLASRDRAATRWLGVSTGLTLALLIAPVVVMLFGPFKPVAFFAALGSIAVGVLIIASALAREVPSIRTLGEARRGDVLVIDGERLVVDGHLEMPSVSTGGLVPLSLVCALESTGEPALVVTVPYDDDKNPTARSITAGGKPLEAQRAGEIAPLSVGAKIPDNAFAGAEPYGLVDRIWIARPNPGDPPTFTIGTPRRLGDVAFLQRD